MSETRELYPYQQEGALFLAQNRRAYLGDEMGLGKTVQAARAAHTFQPEQVLVIAPAAARENWRREWRDWGPYCGFEVSSYAGLLNSSYRPEDFDLVILDEAHYCKNPEAKRTKNALKLAQGAPRAWLLSGTPMPNHPGELYPAIAALWPDHLRRIGVRTYWHWFNHFTRWVPTKYGKRPYAIQNAGQLRHILRDVMRRRLLDDVALELPPLRVDVSLLPRDSRFEESMCEIMDVADVAALKRRLEREEGLGDDGSTSRLRRLLGEYKAPHIAKQVARELEDQEYEKVVVLYYHRSVGARIANILETFNPVGFHGDTPDTKRQLAIDNFTTGDSRVFLAQQSAAGVAINLQAASEIVLVEPAWSPDDNRQAIKRIHRIGQDNPCRARVFAVAGTLDEAVMSTVSQKTRMQEKAGL